jgi:hypothetical protein
MNTLQNIAVIVQQTDFVLPVSYALQTEVKKNLSNFLVSFAQSQRDFTMYWIFTSENDKLQIQSKNLRKKSITELHIWFCPQPIDFESFIKQLVQALAMYFSELPNENWDFLQHTLLSLPQDRTEKFYMDLA